jgi:hypothetical protein
MTGESGADRKLCYDVNVIVRTADRLFVTEDQLDRAIEILETTCSAVGVHPEIEVTSASNPETDDEPVTMLVGHFTEEMDLETSVDLTGEAGAALAAQGLFEPEIRLSFHPRPEW